MKDFKKCDITYLLGKIDLEMLPQLKIASYNNHILCHQCVMCMYQGLEQMLTICLQHHQGCSETSKCAYVIYGQPLICMYYVCILTSNSCRHGSKQNYASLQCGFEKCGNDPWNFVSVFSEYFVYGCRVCLHCYIATLHTSPEWCRSLVMSLNMELPRTNKNTAFVKHVFSQ